MDITLKRSMKFLGALLITLSAITPASSVFIIAPGVIQQAGTGAFWSFIAGAFICVFTAFIYAELASAWPLTGGEYAIVGRVLGPFCGFVILGTNIITLVLIAAVLALGIGTYTGALFPHASAVTIAVISTILITFLGILNIRTNAFITGIFLAIEMLALLTLTILGFLHPSRPMQDLLWNPQHLGAAGSLEPASIGVIGLATAIAVFAYNGYGNAVYLGEETHDAPKHIAHTILWSMLITVIAEAVPVTAVLIGAPDLKALLASPTMLTDFIKTRGGEGMNSVLNLGIALAIFNANLAFFIMVARQLYSSGRDKVWPKIINRGLTRVHKRFHSPWIATFVCGTLVAAACFIPLNFLLVISSTSVIAIYASLCIAALVGRCKGLTKHGHYQMPLFPLPPLISLAALAYVAYANYLDPEVGRPSLFATLGMLVASAAYYIFVLRRRGNWELRGPENN